MGIKWDKFSEEKFNKIIESLPQFHRTIAKKLVYQRAEELAKERKSDLVQDQDLIKAFFQEVPPAFKDMMKRLFDHLDVDYSKYLGERE